MRAALAVTFLLCAGCPDTVGQQCPPKTSVVAQFALSFQGQHDAGECVETFADAGPVAFTSDDGGVRPGTLCFGLGSDGGGQQLWLAVPGNSPRSSDLSPQGGFHFAGSAPGTSGICGSCLIAVDESFDGTLHLAGDAGFGLQADGGLPQITGISGSLVDSLTNTGGGACITDVDAGTGCNTPCVDTYVVTGTPF